MDINGKDKMYYFFIGTNAELIKIMAILDHLKKNKIPYKVILSGQNAVDPDILLRIGIKADIILAEKPSRQSMAKLLWWFVKTFAIGFFKLKKEWQHISKEKVYLIVHGDTISTLMGAYLGFFNRIRVAHIEAGYRSFKFLEPFPEELSRFLVSLVAQVHFCPSEQLLSNLKNRRGDKVNTGLNTFIDSLRIAEKTAVINPRLIPVLRKEKFFLFIMHRQENIFNKHFVRKVIKKICEYQGAKCVFIIHDTTKIALQKYHLLDAIENNKNILMSGKVQYFEFINLLSMAEFLVTDGGGNQQECYYMGKPCLLLRNVCEGNEGIGHNAILAKNNFAVMEYFMKNYKQFKKKPIASNVQPSLVVAQYLMTH